MDREKSINNGLEIIKFIKQNRKAIQETYGRSSIEKPSTKERTREWEDFFNSHYQGDLGQKGLLQESQDIGQERAPEFPTSFDGGDAHDRSGTQRTLDWDSAGDRLLLDTMVANPLINDGRRENTDIRDADKEVQSRSNIRNRDGDRVPSSSSHGVTFPCSSRALTNDEGRSSALDGKNVMELNTKDKMQRGENDSSSTVGTGGDLLSGDKDLIAKLSKISERVTSSRGSDTDTCDEDDGLILIGGLTPKEIDNLIEESNNSEIESRGQPYHNKGSLQGMNKENQGIIADQTGAHTQPNNSQQKGGQATTGNSRENGKAVAYSHQEGDLKPKGQVTSIINEEQGYRTDSVKDDFVKIDVTEYTKPKPKLPRKPVRQIRKSEQSGNPNAIGSIEIESTTSDPFEISMRQFKKGINETTTSSGTGSLSPSTDGAHLTAEKTDPQLQTSTASADDALLSAQNVSSDPMSNTYYPSHSEFYNIEPSYAYYLSSMGTGLRNQPDRDLFIEMLRTQALLLNKVNNLTLAVDDINKRLVQIEKFKTNQESIERSLTKIQTALSTVDGHLSSMMISIPGKSGFPDKAQKNPDLRPVIGRDTIFQKELYSLPSNPREINQVKPVLREDLILEPVNKHTTYAANFEPNVDPATKIVLKSLVRSNISDLKLQTELLEIITAITDQDEMREFYEMLNELIDQMPTQ